MCSGIENNAHFLSLLISFVLKIHLVWCQHFGIRSWPFSLDQKRTQWNGYVLNNRAKTVLITFEFVAVLQDALPHCQYFNIRSREEKSIESDRLIRSAIKFGHVIECFENPKRDCKDTERKSTEWATTHLDSCTFRQKEFNYQSGNSFSVKLLEQRDLCIINKSAARFLS